MSMANVFCYSIDCYWSIESSHLEWLQKHPARSPLQFQDLGYTVKAATRRFDCKNRVDSEFKPSRSFRHVRSIALHCLSSRTHVGKRIQLLKNIKNTTKRNNNNKAQQLPLRKACNSSTSSNFKSSNSSVSPRLPAPGPAKRGPAQTWLAWPQQNR